MRYVRAFALQSHITSQSLYGLMRMINITLVDSIAASYTPFYRVAISCKLYIFITQMFIFCTSMHVIRVTAPHTAVDGRSTDNAKFTLHFIRGFFNPWNLYDS
jgi:hypothetical protein